MERNKMSIVGFIVVGALLAIGLFCNLIKDDSPHNH